MDNSSAPSNVQVAVRLRPLNGRERLAGSTESLHCASGTETGGSIAAGPDHHFAFDAVYGPASEQAQVFDELTRPVLDSFLQGYNCTIIAYGQTGSGKTFTMGTGMDGNLDESTQGIIPRAVNYITEAFRNNSSDPDSPIPDMYVSFIEIYNEDIIDLLGSQGGATASRTARKLICIREDSRGEITLTGVKEERIQSSHDILALLQKGTLSRTTKSTDMNLVSSRSHAIFTLLCRRRVGKVLEADAEKTIVSKLHFVDLAGSERLKRTNAQGDRIKESISINSGLLALGNVISALGDPGKRTVHVPYRDSKLTRLLQDSLGGNSRTLMIACASPSSDNFPESLNTLKYAARAKNIQNRLHINEETGGDAAFEIAQLKKQIASLKHEILQLRTSRQASNGNGANGPSGGSVSSANGSVPSNTIDASELSRLRVQTADLKRRLVQLAKEKATLEAERDFYRVKGAAGGAGGNAAATGTIKVIADLKVRIAELEMQAKTASSAGNPASPGKSLGSKRVRNEESGNIPQPQTPVWLRQANVLVDRARAEIRDNLASIKDIERTAAASFSGSLHSSSSSSTVSGDIEMANPFTANGSVSGTATPSKASSSSSSSSSSSGSLLTMTQAQFQAAVATRSETLLSKIRSDMTIREELIQQFQVCQEEYNSMRRNYDEKIKLMHESLLLAQRERDLAFKSLQTPKTAPAQAASHPSHLAKKYEERIKGLGRELNEMRAKLKESTRQAQQKTAVSETTVKNLKQALDVAKTEKNRLSAKLADETSRLRTDCFAHDSEIKDLRQREHRAMEASRKLKKAFDFQKVLLQKRVDQYMQAKQRIRLLLNTLRKRHISLDSPSLNSPFWRSESLAPGSQDHLGEEKSPTAARNSGSRRSSDLAMDAEEGDEYEDAAMNGSSNDHVNDEDDDSIPLPPDLASEALLTADELVANVTLMELDDEDIGADSADDDTGHQQSDPSGANNPFLAQGAASTLRTRKSFTGRPLNAVLSPKLIGHEVPRSALRHSPLLHKRKDVFARLAEGLSAASSQSISSSTKRRNAISITHPNPNPLNATPQQTPTAKSLRGSASVSKSSIEDLYKTK